MSLIILAHPHFDSSIANKTIIEELNISDLNIEIRNLHDLYPDFCIDVIEEQKALLRHQTTVFQYPFFWYNMPAILKQWFDAVFIHQFAYGSEGDKLKGKNFLPSFTVGSFEDQYTTLGKHHFRIYEFCKNLEQTAYYAQMNYINPVYMHGTSGVSGYKESVIKEKAKSHAGRLIDCLKELDHNQPEPATKKKDLPVC
ncbi:MAG: NAD(P)H-dependent oxidoreductase [Candidatus Pseudobacter hemicellulosilyticus]|uniref:NAD(P)H-dependent oxidoreductase n=1 Tax=Candidatus Pseudobacter hemicellulosilyticus TaxID=3121375 RepID=A0AAJ5WM59_9BACT|nr:MAG: NAD(P)H-dependent oxidoreductase [Pseudobacter sp.]